MNPSIFKAYDIRGIYPDELNLQDAFEIGRFFVARTKAEKVIVSRDGRLSSLALFESLARGITEQGADVIDIGQISTDALYFASGFLNLPAIMITASHNPPQYNGFKLRAAGAEPIAPSDLLKKTADLPQSVKSGQIIEKNILSDYKNHIFRLIETKNIKPFKIVIDAGNGIAGKMAPEIFDNIPCQIIPLYFELDGSFPHRSPNPSETGAVKDLQSAVIENQADLGLAFDGDADRVVFVDEKGQKIFTSFIICLIAKSLLLKSHQPHLEKIIYSLNCSHIIKETIEKYGGQAIMERVGTRFITEKMRKENAVFGGEISGHYYFRDNCFSDSAFIAALTVLEMLSLENKSFSGVLKEFEKYYGFDEINIETDKKEEILKLLEKKYSDGKISHFDGMTIEYDDWWFNLRPSNTEPLLRLNLEAVNKELAEKKRDEILNLIA